MKNKADYFIPQNIKKYRLLNNMTQEELAGLLYLDTQYYAQLERGERNFTIEKIVMVCQIFHIGVEDIIDTGQSFDVSSSVSVISQINQKLHSLNHTQLLVLNKLIDDIFPYIK